MRSRFVAVPLLALTVALLAGCSPSTESAEAQATPEGCEYLEAAGGVREVEVPDSDADVPSSVKATIATSAGDIAVTLDGASAPCTVASFLSLADQGYFDDTECHRLTTSGIFVLQCGDPSATGRGGPGYRYADELDGSETYPAGTLAMANSGSDTNGSQFFLVYEDTTLAPDYTVFGQMDAAGINIVREVAKGGTASDGVAPATAVTITAVTTN